MFFRSRIIVEWVLEGFFAYILYAFKKKIMNKNNLPASLNSFVFIKKHMWITLLSLNPLNTSSIMSSDCSLRWSNNTSTLALRLVNSPTASLTVSNTWATFSFCSKLSGSNSSNKKLWQCSKHDLNGISLYIWTAWS